MKTIIRFIYKVLAGMLFAVLWLFSLLPLRIGFILSDGMYYIVYYLVRYRRHVVRKNLTSSFPEKSSAEIVGIEKQFYHWFCDYIVETFKMMTISRSEMARRMTFTGMDTMKQCIEEGQSVAIFLGHYCNWEWISTLPLAAPEKALCAELYHPLENPEFNNLFLYMRQRFGSVCLPMHEALRHIIKYRNEGQPLIVGYIADQKPLWHNMHFWMPFLGHDTPMLTGSDRIVQRMDQAVFYGEVSRPKRGYYVCEMQLVTRHPKELGEYGITEAYMTRLENTIRQHPAYWLWSHDRWSRTREEFDQRFYEKDGKVFEKTESKE
ncbi:MAG: lysophospholipid acyltransferase family protein [Prevotella sp.]|nr:lysophospholipid acyltransferase family protein [Prevotella sp.]